MTNHTADTSPNKIRKAAGLALPLVIISTILKWIWLIVKGLNSNQINKSEKFWDMISNDFDKQAKDEKSEKNHISTIENTKKYLSASDIVLDYGCATGTVAIEIADKVKKIHGIDISSKMIDAAKRKAGECKIENIDFTQSSIFDERHKKGSFDVVLAFNILHLLEDTSKVVQRINGLLKPEGLIISVTACMGEKKTLLSIFLFALVKIGIIPFNMRFFKISELKDLISNGNFLIIQVENLPNNPLEYFIVAKKI